MVKTMVSGYDFPNKTNPMSIPVPKSAQIGVPRVFAMADAPNCIQVLF